MLRGWLMRRALGGLRLVHRRVLRCTGRTKRRVGVLRMLRMRLLGMLELMG